MFGADIAYINAFVSSGGPLGLNLNEIWRKL